MSPPLQYPSSSPDRITDDNGSIVEADIQAIAAQGVTNALALGDVDGDGDLDLLMGDVHATASWLGPARNQLYLNDGRGFFVDATLRLTSAPRPTVSSFTTL